MTRARDIAKFAGNLVDSTGGLLESGVNTIIDEDYISGFTSGGGIAISVYSSLDSLPRTGNSAGDLAFIDSANKHYVFSGEGWYNVNFPQNFAPTFTGLQDSYSFNFADSDFTITLIGSDSNALDGLTFSFSGDDRFDSVASISQGDTGVFTVTPDADSGGFTIESTVTFSVTDGRSITSSSTLFKAIGLAEPESYIYLWTPGGEFGNNTGVTVTTNGLSTLTTGLATETVSGEMSEISTSGDYLRIQYNNIDFTREAGKYKFVWAWYIPSYDGSLKAGLSVRDEDSRIVSFSTETNGGQQQAVFQGTDTTSRNLSPTMDAAEWYIMTPGSSYALGSLIAAKVPGDTPYTISTTENRGYAHGYAANDNEFIAYSSSATGITGFNRSALTSYIAGVAIYPTSMTDEEMLNDFDTVVFGN